MVLPKVSIIIPVYNVEPYIAGCLQSVMNQTYQGPLECIVVDDCGTDRSMEIVARMIAGYDGPIEFKVFHQEQNLGISVARNIGIDASSGEYVFFLDSDDLISEDCIGYLVSLTVGKSFEMIAGGNDVFRGEYVEKGKENETAVVEKISGQEFLLNWIRYYSSVISAWNKLYLKKHLQKKNVRFKSIPLSEDVLFNFELFYKPSTIYVSNHLTYHYRRREGSIVDVIRKNPEKYRDDLVLFWQELKKVCDDGLDDIHEEYLHFYGLLVFTMSREYGLPFYHIFNKLHKNYPYSPIRMWLLKDRGFRWYKKRMMWSLPSLLGFVWLQLKWRKNRVFGYEK